MTEPNIVDLDDSRHPVWDAVAPIASFEAIRNAVTAADPDLAVTHLIEGAVLAAVAVTDRAARADELRKQAAEWRSVIDVSKWADGVTEEQARAIVLLVQASGDDFDRMSEAGREKYLRMADMLLTVGAKTARVACADELRKRASMIRRYVRPHPDLIDNPEDVELVHAIARDLEVTAESFDPPARRHNPCCSSHEVPMSCAYYRRTHFVEVRPCCEDDARLLSAPTEEN